MNSDLTRNSRDGDMFHYRWAARRCLRLLDPKLNLDYITIEGSSESEARGEYLIDIAEYERMPESDYYKIIYYQLKHSTKRVDQPFTLSELKRTFEGFAERFLDIINDKKFNNTITFKIITNRQVSVSLKKGIEAVAKNLKTTKTFIKTLKNYTTINDKNILMEFCRKIEIIDTEGDYNEQRFELSAEISKFLAESSNDATIDNLIGLIHKYALSDKENERIRKENILRILGVNSEKELFPAPNEMESIKGVIIRAQYKDILKEIINIKEHIIIHASGGVGKSILARYLADNLPNDSIGLVYDCFGAGKYRNPQHPRHTHKFGIVQIINELALLGLCDFLIPQQSDSKDAFLRRFTEKLKDALDNLRKINKNAELAIIVDAADNAEMAAKEFNTDSFCKDLLRTEFPTGCKLIELCRSERVDKLDPPTTVKKIELKNFDRDESILHCKMFFPNMSSEDCILFHKLTSANPRVQIYSLESTKSVSELLDGLGPSPISLDDQIGTYIEKAINQLKDNSVPSFRNNIDVICTCLGSLPPFIPVNVLHKASNIAVSEIKSFISDLKKPILLSGDSVQFKDEPTETWFRENYSATKEQLNSFVTAIKPLANESTYVAEVLPFLLLQAGRYKEVIGLAFSEESLPNDNPVDKRNIKLSRIQFAFKAALKEKCYCDAAKLALLAGEETAGEQRQLELLTNNIDLTTTILSKNKVYEVASKRKLEGNWQGSENVYSASMFSFIKEFEGESRAYLRSAQNWLNIYFERREEQKKDGKSLINREKLEDQEIAELAFACLNLDGVDRAVDFIQAWSPKSVVFQITRYITKRLIDLNRFDEVCELYTKSHESIYMMLAISDEMLEVGKFINAKYLKNSLSLVYKNSKKINLSENHSLTRRNDLACGLLALLEQCLRAKLSKSQLLKIINNYFPKISFPDVIAEHSSYSRIQALRVIALKSVLNNDLTPDLNLFVPNDSENKSHDYTQRRDKTKRILGDNLPWYIARLIAIGSDKNSPDQLIKNATDEARKNDSHYLYDNKRQESELNNIRFDIDLFCSNNLQSEYEYFSNLLKNKTKCFFLTDRIRALRIICRNNSLLNFKSIFELSCRESIKELHSATEDGSPGSISDYYIEMSRALLAIDKEDAACYFDSAIEIVSKYGN